MINSLSKPSDCVPKRIVILISLCFVLFVTGLILTGKWVNQVNAEDNRLSSEGENVPSASSTTPTPSASIPVTATINPMLPVSPDAYTGFRLAIGRLDKVQDYTAVTLDEEYNSLLFAVSKLTVDEITQKVNPKITFKDLMSNPAKYRGALVRVKGNLIVGPQVFDYPTTNTAGIQRYYAGMIKIDPETNRHYHFHLIDRPNKYDAFVDNRWYGDMVWIEGAFLKIERYEKSEMVGGGTNDAAFIIGRRMYREEDIVTNGISGFRWFLVGLIILAVFIVVIIIIFSGKKDRISQQQRMDKLSNKIGGLNKPKDSSKQST